MTKKELKESIYKQILNNENGAGVIEIWQDRPYTAVRVYFTHYDNVLDVYGFSKVSHPDEWDANFGLVLAVKRAVSKIVKRIGE